MKATPIMLRSFGRSGSTLLMQLLGTHRNVLFDKKYPYETRHLSYIYRLASVLKKDLRVGTDWNVDSIFDASLDHIGPIPYKDFDLYDKSAMSNDFLMRLLNGFSHQIIEHNKNEIIEDEPVYYAEKVVIDICEEVNKLVEAKNLFLFRDPRDEFLSIKSFNERRNTNGFGWDKELDELEFAKKLCQMRAAPMRFLANIKLDDRRMFVKYEDVMESPYEVTEKISNWLGISLDYNEVLKNKANVSQHITSEKNGPRWKGEMSKSLLDVFNSELENELLALGYEL